MRISIVAGQIVKSGTKTDNYCCQQDKYNQFHQFSHVASGEHYNVNEKAKKPLPTWLPLVVGAVSGRSVRWPWRLAGFSRPREARGPASLPGRIRLHNWHDGMDVRSFQRLKASGHYLTRQQIVLDNIIINSRYGHYVMTPLEIAADKPLLLVNRGWIEKTAGGFDVDDWPCPTDKVTVRGRAGSLPKAGYKMGDAIAADQSWPMHAVYPIARRGARCTGPRYPAVRVTHGA